MPAAEPQQTVRTSPEAPSQQASLQATQAPSLPHPDGATAAGTRITGATAEPPASSSEASESEAEAPAATEEQAGWSLANMFLGGIKSMGRAVQITGKLVEQVNDEAQTVMGRYVSVRPTPLELQRLLVDCLHVLSVLLGNNEEDWPCSLWLK